MSESFTTLKGFSSLSSVDMQTSIEANLVSFFEWGLLNKGGYTNIRLADSNIDSSNRAILRRVQEPGTTNGKVFATYRQNLVHESGVTGTYQPTQISGVYIDGVFKLPNDATYAHYVDYKNGQVVFSSAVPSSKTVKMEYSYKNISITTGDIFPYVQDVQFRTRDLTVPDYNTSASGDWSSLGRKTTQLPIISIEISPRVTLTPLELGGTGHRSFTDVLFHVLGETPDIVRKLMWIVAIQKDKTIYMYDPDLAARNNAFPLTYQGRINTSGKQYPDLVKSVANGGYMYNKLYFEDTGIQGPNAIGSLYHGVVRVTSEVITIL